MEFDRLFRLPNHKTSEPKSRNMADIEEDFKYNDALRQISRTIAALPLGYVGSEALLFHRLDISHPVVQLLFVITPPSLAVYFHLRDKAKHLIQEHNQLSKNIASPDPKTHELESVLE